MFVFRQFEALKAYFADLFSVLQYSDGFAGAHIPDLSSI